MAGLDGAGSTAAGLETLDDLHRAVISDLAEDDVLSIKPGGDNGGNEELRAVAKS